MDAERPGDPADHAEHPDGHLGDLVADLAGGSLGDADPALVLDHLADCEHCRAELADSVVAAAALRQFALSPVAALSPVVPPAGVEAAPAAVSPGPPAGDAGLTHSPVHRAGRRNPVLVATAAVVGLTLVAGGGLVLGRATAAAPSAGPPVSSPAPPSVGPSAAVSPAPSGAVPDGGPTVGAATVVRLVPAGSAAAGTGVGTLVLGGEGTTRRMALFAVGLAAPGRGRVYEVWLGGPDPLAVGALDGSGSGSWVMPVTVAAGHRQVLVVRQEPGATALAAGSVVATAQLS